MEQTNKLFDSNKNELDKVVIEGGSNNALKLPEARGVRGQSP